MKILLDECIPKRLARQFVGHAVRTVEEMGWKGITNGDLLALAEKEFEVFLTVDRNLPFQQHLTKLNIAVVILIAPSNSFEDLNPLMPKILAELPNTRRGQAVTVGG